MMTFAYCASPPPAPEKEESSVSFVHDKDVSEDKEGIGMPAVYAVATPTEPENKDQ